MSLSINFGELSFDGESKKNLLQMAESLEKTNNSGIGPKSDVTRQRANVLRALASAKDPIEAIENVKRLLMQNVGQRNSFSPIGNGLPRPMGTDETTGQRNAIEAQFEALKQSLLSTRDAQFFT